MFIAWNEVLKWIFTGKSVVLLELMISLLWYSTFLPPSSALRHIPLNLPPSSVPSTSVLPSPTTTPSLLPSPPPPPFPSHLSDPSSLLFPVYLSSFISLSLLSSLSLFFHLFILFPLSFSPLSSLFFLSSLCALSSLSGHSIRNVPARPPTPSEFALIKVYYSYMMFSKGFGTLGRNSQPFLKNRAIMFRIWRTPENVRIWTKFPPGRTAAVKRMPV